MASYLLDTNILAARVNAGDPHNGDVIRALSALAARRQVLRLTPQVLIEYHRVCTRTAGEGGLGMSHEEAIRERVRAARLFSLLPETPDVFAYWERLLDAVSVRGKQVHDARIAAACLAGGVDHLLTYNTRDFTRYEGRITGARFSAVAPHDI